MTHRRSAGTFVRALTVAGIASTAALMDAGAAEGADPAAEVTAWASQQADPLSSTDPTASLEDVAPLRRSIDDATIVGLGESAHGASEETTLKHRALRLLVEELGFRTVAWEEDWTTGVALDAYIHGGPQDLDDVMASMSPQYQTREVADVVSWLRRFNAGRRDQVSFFGVEYSFTGRPAYDGVDRYVASTAPDLLDELRGRLARLRPTSDDPFEHIATYSQVADKQPYLDDARAARDLVARVPHRPGDRGHAIALHAAEQIVSFHEHYAMSEADNVVYREEQAAGSLRWWQRLTGDRAGPGAIVDGGSLSEWFDLLVHTQVVHPAGAT
jgi:erythromycin esterase